MVVDFLRSSGLSVSSKSGRKDGRLDGALTGLTCTERHPYTLFFRNKTFFVKIKRVFALLTQYGIIEVLRHRILWALTQIIL